MKGAEEREVCFSASFGSDLKMAVLTTCMIMSQAFGRKES